MLALQSFFLITVGYGGSYVWGYSVIHYMQLFHPYVLFGILGLMWCCTRSLDSCSTRSLDFTIMSEQEVAFKLQWSTSSIISTEKAVCNMKSIAVVEHALNSSYTAANKYFDTHCLTMVCKPEPVSLERTTRC